MTIADRDPIAEKRSPIAIGDLLIGDRSCFAYRSATIFAGGENRNLDLILRPDGEIGFVYFNFIGQIFKIPQDALEIYSWQHFCMSINQTIFQVIVQGKTWDQGPHKLSNFSINVDRIKFAYDSTSRWFKNNRTSQI